jgi:hypothetical protein
VIFQFVIFDFRSVQRRHSLSRSRCCRSDPVLFLLAVQRAVPSHWSAQESLALSVRGAGRPALRSASVFVDLEIESCRVLLLGHLELVHGE